MASRALEATNQLAEERKLELEHEKADLQLELH